MEFNIIKIIKKINKKRKTRRQLKQIIKLAAPILFVVLILFVILYCFQVAQFNQGMQTKFSRQELSFPYYLKAGQEPYTLILGDLNGLNKDSFLNLQEFSKETYLKKASLIVVPTILPLKSKSLPKKINKEDFYAQITNDRGVVLTDNFCTNNWNNLKEKEIYVNSQLSPGPFCISENETKDLRDIMKEFSVKKIFLVYDTEAYKKFIKNFLDYLEENNINYEFVQSKELEKIKKNI